MSHSEDAMIYIHRCTKTIDDWINEVNKKTYVNHEKKIEKQILEIGGGKS